ncbi:hypothetical protein Ga0609869_002801 [Rhodovulum iodosum]|uniref:Phasin domain-containing protein n=1 Tax=Rhodovulum iodosum TaxID=68291 RepID=A0ABV3XYS3_9RHOB|nr:phasin family protein [Rhodovulum robiginosum]
MATQETHDSDTDSPIAALTGAQAEGLGLMAWLGTATLQNMRILGAEMANFTADRMGKDLRAQQALWNCRNPEDVVAVQAGYVEETLSDYADAAGRLAEMGGDMFDKALERAR